MIGLRLNNYEIVSILGQGGMGTVYLARHTFTGRKAAVKLLHPEYARDPVLVSRLMNEARATAAIGHPNIIDIIDVGLLPDGITPYLMMEFLQGESLAGRLQRSRPLPMSEAIEIACQTASALSAAHACGIIHRDLKPDNLFLVPDASILPLQQRVKVLDFGIAKLKGDLTGGSVKTRTGTIMGTPQYMSPEQCRGVVQDIDHRTDIYTLGIIVYEMVCGSPPFLSEGVGEMLVMHLTCPPTPPRTVSPDVPEDLEATILCALAKEPNERFASMDEFQAALRASDVQPALTEDGRPLARLSSGFTPPPVSFPLSRTAAPRAPTQMSKPATLAAAPTGNPPATVGTRAPGTTLSSSAGQVVAEQTQPARRSQPLVRWAALVGGLLVAAVAVYAILLSRGKSNPGPSSPLPSAAAPAPVVAPAVPPPAPPVPIATPPAVVAPPLPATAPAPVVAADHVPAVNPKDKARGKKRGTRSTSLAAPGAPPPTAARPVAPWAPPAPSPAAQPSERW